MTDHQQIREALERLEGCARLLGATQAKKGFGVYTEDDSRLERTWHEGIANCKTKALAALSRLEAAAVPVGEVKPVAEVWQNASGQIALRASDGSAFDVSKYVGHSFYTTPPAPPEGWRMVPVAWITHESVRRLKAGGNDSRGSVPVHAKRSSVANIPLCFASAPQPGGKA